ncbi:MAG: hypothetical protein IPO83_09425 [Chitinophagaceae bacterium]|nr:hypothetical protein [Chitinophagaceae bacterium]
MPHHNQLLLFIFSMTLPFFSPAQSTGCISGNCMDGMGTYLFSDKAEYTGEWVNGQRTGVGCYDWADGSYYLGYFKSGILEGNGIYLGNDKDKTTYVGIFHDGKYSESRDFGTSGCLIGSCYEGAGIYLWTNNDIYVGEWHNGNRSGYGRFDWADGSFYTGYFKDGLLDGRGYYTKEDGTIMDGYFQQNKFIGSTSSDYSQTSQSTGNATAQNYSYVTYDDVCSILQQVIKSYSGDFYDIKGRKRDLLILENWESTVSLKGSIESGLFASLDDEDIPSFWYNDLYTFTDVKQALDKYDEVVSDFKNCPNYCCTFTQYTSSTPNEKYTTTFESSTIKSGYSSDYNDMQVIFELTYSENTKEWGLELEVQNKRGY